jgi:hypothetical protein
VYLLNCIRLISVLLSGSSVQSILDANRAFVPNTSTYYPGNTSTYFPGNTSTYSPGSPVPTAAAAFFFDFSDFSDAVACNEQDNSVATDP